MAEPASDPPLAETTVDLGARPPTPPSLPFSGHELPARVGGYRVIERLGMGGMGDVLLAWDEGLSRRVALKRIRSEREGDAEVRRRFDLEARVTARLQHPAILPVYRYEPDGGEDGCFYTMRPVEGISFAELVTLQREELTNPDSSWTTRRVVRLFLQAANAIAFAHSRGVIHRDLKPANVMVGPFEEVLVLDWGMAKVRQQSGDPPAAVASRRPPTGPLRAETEPLTLVGTPGYMAPELLDLRPATPASDQFALALILYELLALRTPWQGATVEERRAAMRTPPPRPTRLRPGRGIPRELASVIMRALSTEPQLRYGSVAAFTRAVSVAIEGRAAWADQPGGRDAEHWRLADGRASRGGEAELTLRPRYPGKPLRYFYTERSLDEARLLFEFNPGKPGGEVSVWLSTQLGGGGSLGAGYELTLLPGRRKTLPLRRSGREVAGAASPGFDPRGWHRVVAERVGGEVSLSVDGERVLTYHDPIPLAAGYLGLVAHGELRLRGLRVEARTTSATVSCLAVPDAFFNRELFVEARAEYERVAASHPGRSEARLARFRAGLCQLELLDREPERDLRLLMLEDAAEAFTPAEEDGCLEWLWRAMIADRRGLPGETRDALERALRGFEHDPQLAAAREWLLARLHGLDPQEDRLGAALLLPLALDAGVEGWSRRLVSDRIRVAKAEWETPSFFTGRGRFRLADQLSRAEARLFFSFWSGRSAGVLRALAQLVELDQLRAHHVADGVLSLLALGQTLAAEEALDATEAPAARGGGKRAAAWELARLACQAARGDLESSEAALLRMPVETESRAYNSARLAVARAAARLGEPQRALAVLELRGARDSFAREQRAWLLLEQGQIEAAEVELAPLLERGNPAAGRSLLALLRGCQLAGRGQRGQAIRLFEKLPAGRWPRSWTLAAHCLAGNLRHAEAPQGDPLGGWLAGAFPYELRRLRAGLLLWERATGEPQANLLGRIDRQLAQDGA